MIQLGLTAEKSLGIRRRFLYRLTRSVGYVLNLLDFCSVRKKQQGRANYIWLKYVFEKNRYLTRSLTCILYREAENLYELWEVRPRGGHIGFFLKKWGNPLNVWRCWRINWVGSNGNHVKKIEGIDPRKLRFLISISFFFSSSLGLSTFCTFFHGSWKMCIYLLHIFQIFLTKKI